MMKLRYSLLLTALLFVGMNATQAGTPGRDYSKTIKKQFNISPNGTASFDNQMGNLEIRTWDQPAVRVEVTIQVAAKNEDRAQDVFDRIDIDFFNNANSVRVETEIRGGGNWNSGWNDNNGKDKFRVHYLVTAPPSLKFNLRNRYGDIKTGELDNDVVLSSSYGNVSLGNVGGALTADLKYGNGQVGNVGNLSGELAYYKLGIRDAGDVTLDIRYSSFRANDLRNLTLDSRHNDIELGKLDRFTYDGRYDKVEIGTANRLTADAHYTTIHAERVFDELRLDMRYGGVRVDRLERGFSAAYLDGNYTDYHIVVEPGANFQLDAEVEYAGVRYPNDMEITREIEKGTSHHVRAYAGTPNARSVIRARLDYGGLRLTD